MHTQRPTATGAIEMGSGLTAHYRMLGRYNRLANERLYAACAELDDEARRADRGAFFASIHGTLNHIMVGDRIWMARFEGGHASSQGLDAILHDDFDELRSARVAEDARIEAFADRLDDDALAGSIEYVNNEGVEFDDPMAVLLTHFFNHQTHHRGQVTAMVAQTDAPYPVLDMHRVLIPEPGRSLG